jgi:hypothetical protein
MKYLSIASTIGIGLFAGGYALAQDATFVIRPEQRTVVHQYIVKEHVKPMMLKERVEIGTAIPQDVELAPMPEAIYTKIPASKRYEYFDWNGHAVFVDPESRMVVQIVE